MRFAYIDSNGNEVPIPSVDALALRIELGAITENTQLYDAQAEEWGPAHTHEIFHTLSRDAEEKDGFIAPPPVTPPPAASTPEAGQAGTPTDPGVSAEAPGAPPAASPGSVEPQPGPEAPVEPEPEAEGEGDFGLTLADAPADEGADDDDPTADDLPYLDLEPEQPQSEDEEEEPMDLTPSEEDGEVPGFDFGGMEGALELEETFEPSAGDALDFGAGEDEGLGGEMELETAREFDSGSFDAEEDESLDLEAPMSDFSPDEPPSWMDESEPDDAEVLDFSAAGSGSDDATESDSADDVPLRDRRTPRTRPSPPKFRKQRNLAVPIVGVVILLAVGLGGYVAWPLVSDRLSGSGADEEPPVVIPTLDPELVPVMREASSAALAAIFEEARAEWASDARVQEPPSDWLAGVYLARAGEFEDVETFWSGMGDFVDRVRGIQLSSFDAALAAELQARGVAGAEAEAIRERADSGFVAAAPDRAEVFQRFEELIDAALGLHDFLVANEENIAYAPAAAVTTDPVLEVDPSTPEIRNAMEDLLDRVTRSLSTLEYRDRVTATGLRTMILNRIREEGVR